MAIPRVAVRSIVVGALVGASLAALVALPARPYLVSFLDWAAQRGAWTGLVLAVAWIPAAVLLLPGSVLSLGTGFVLGLGWGVATVSVGSTLGAAAAFAVGRWMGRERVRRRIVGHERLAAVDTALRDEGLRVVLLTRLSPILPYNLLNYGFSLTGVSLRDYVLGSWIGMLPGTVLYVYIGTGLRTAGAVATRTSHRGPGQLALLAVGLVATGVVVALVTRAARRALARRLGEKPA